MIQLFWMEHQSKLWQHQYFRDCDCWTVSTTDRYRFRLILIKTVTKYSAQVKHLGHQARFSSLATINDL
jgi:hypothetical protein